MTNDNLENDSFDDGADENQPILRIDGSHRRGKRGAPKSVEVPPADAVLIVSPEELPTEEVSQEVLSYIAGRDPAAVQSQLDEQAIQLASHMAARLKELDRREATLNARIAQLETEVRLSRLADRERVMATAEREKEIEQREQILHDLEHDFARRDSALREQEGTHQASGIDASALAQREDQLRARRQDLDRAASNFHHAQLLWDREKATQEQAAADKLAAERAALELEYAARHKRLDEVELQLLAQTQQVASELRSLSDERATWNVERERQLRAIEKRSAVAEEQLARKTKAIATRETMLDEQQRSLLTLQDQLHTMHRETLEMRLIAEQLWAQTSGRLSTPEVMQSIAALRLKLAEHYQIDLAQVAKEREELSRLATRLAEQARALDSRHQELKTWRSREQQAVEHDARQLLAQQIELEEQSSRLAAERATWQEERRRLLAEIRELRKAELTSV
ncbi:hypothetical protein Psta_0947 [Pirellula staleyi DSM 6068]|uniref:Uncharacterized protein n=1 Tax=Pirellula staleyi (strain ATCC 27377 / DSM 6068 / ICPB 4128) TaxID=530564 RepID=D2R7D6_PIRSD|nr:hypothetical protein [Pirellula staleyi]ADB15632.1 hypothetical protein Psta_0947 [Pirellula staleyi DSM 6068]